MHITVVFPSDLIALAQDNNSIYLQRVPAYADTGISVQVNGCVFVRACVCVWV